MDQFPREPGDVHEEDSLKDYGKGACACRNAKGLFCTLRLGHAGDHVAGGLADILDRWPKGKV